MKRILLTNVAILILASSYSQAFSFTDTSFQPGSYYRFDYAVNLDHGACTTNPCYEYNKKLYDSLVSFLNTHPLFKIEIGAHNDGMEPDQMPFSETEFESRAMKMTLVWLGIDEKRVSFKGYENQRPIITREIMLKLSEEERINARSLNRRMEIILTSLE